MSPFQSEMVSLNDEESYKHEIHADPIDVNTSLSPLAQTPISFDSILRKCGDLGRFQLIHYFFINLVAMSAGIMGFFYVFGAAEPNHRCRLPESIWPNDSSYYPINSIHQTFIEQFIPKTKDEQSWEQCFRYSKPSMPNSTVNCPNGWVYDRSVFGYTYTEEANFVCSRATEKSWLATLLQTGGFSLLIIGSLADRFGRKRATVIVTIFLFVVCVTTQLIIQFIPMSMEVKFTLLLLNQFASGLTAATFSLIFILLLELTSSAHTSLAGNLALVSFTIGEMIVTLFAYLAKDWQILKWANTAFVGLILPYLYFMPESPLYLYSRRQYDQLEALLRRMAKRNQRKESEWYLTYQSFIRSQPVASLNEEKVPCCAKVQQFFRDKSTLLKLVIIALIGFSSMLLYIKISYGLAVMNISPYLGILIGAVVEAAGYVTGSILISTRIGRRGSFILMMILTIICVVLIPNIITISALATVFIAQFGKFSISGAIAVSWIFVPELFPTSTRSGANGFFIAFGRIGAIVAPIINSSIALEYQSYASYASAGLGVLVVLLTLILPETKDKSMDDG